DAARTIGDADHAGRIGPDEVALNDVVVRVGVDDRDGVHRVTRDDIPCARHGAANGVAAGTGSQGDSALGRRVRQRRRTSSVDADVVALHQVAGGGRVLQGDAGPLGAGDDVA